MNIFKNNWCCLFYSLSIFRSQILDLNVQNLLSLKKRFKEKWKLSFWSLKLLSCSSINRDICLTQTLYHLSLISDMFLQGFVFEFIDNADSQNPKTYFGYLMFEKEFHGSDGIVKIPIHSADHEYLGSLSGKLNAFLFALKCSY